MRGTCRSTKMTGCRPRGTTLWIIAVFWTLLAGGSADYTGHFTNDFAVEIDGDLAEADLVADIHGFHVEKQVGSFTVSQKEKLSKNSLIMKYISCIV